MGAITLPSARYRTEETVGKDGLSRLVKSGAIDLIAFHPDID
jgi:hypothetical protein